MHKKKFHENITQTFTEKNYNKISQRPGAIITNYIMKLHSVHHSPQNLKKVNHLNSHFHLSDSDFSCLQTLTSRVIKSLPKWNRFPFRVTEISRYLTSRSHKETFKVKVKTRYLLPQIIKLWCHHFNIIKLFMALLLCSNLLGNILNYIHTFL